MKRVVGVLSVSVLLAMASGCNPAVDQPAGPRGPGDTDEAAVAETAAVARLPISLNALMVAIVNQAADPIWVAAWHNPAGESDWRELERRAVQLEVGGALLQVPGTGPLDDVWAGSSAWQDWAGQLQQVGAEAVTAVRARDLEAISAVGDRIVEICEGCHIEFKPALPTGGQFGELSPTEADLKNGEES